MKLTFWNKRKVCMCIFCSVLTNVFVSKRKKKERLKDDDNDDESNRLKDFLCIFLNYRLLIFF